METPELFTDISDIVDSTQNGNDGNGGNGGNNGNVQANSAEVAETSDIGSIFSEIEAGMSGNTGAGPADTIKIADNKDLSHVLASFGIPADKEMKPDEIVSAIKQQIETSILAENNDEARDLKELLDGAIEDRIESFVRTNAKQLLLENEQEILEKIDEILEDQNLAKRYDKQITEKINGRLDAIKKEIEDAAVERANREKEIKDSFEKSLKEYRITNYQTKKEEGLPMAVQNIIREFFWGEQFIEEIRKDPIGFVLKTHPKLSPMWEKNMAAKYYNKGVSEAIKGLEQEDLKIGKGGTFTPTKITEIANLSDIV